jgi:two-component system, NtrC family, nitrogen regulation sensor histidine kinase NtrY
MLKKRRIILFLSIILLGFILSLIFLFDKGEQNVVYHGKQVENQLAQVVKRFDKDYINILMENRPNKQVSFKSLNTDTDHPFYLFSAEGHLVYWSDITMVPDFNDFSISKKFQLIKNAKGEYFSQLRKFNRNSKSYWVLHVYPLYDNVEIQNDFLNAGPNPEVFGNSRYLLSEVPEDGYLDLYLDGDYLFSALFRVGYNSPGHNINQVILVFFFSLLALVLIVGGDFVITIWNKGRHALATFYAALLLGSIRILMLFFNFPKDFFQTGLFDPRQYASSFVNPSLGDLLLNVVCYLVVFSMFIAILSKKRVLITFFQFRNRNPLWIYLVAAYLMSTILMWLFFSLYINIVDNAQWSLNIESLPNFDLYKAISLIIIFLGGVGYLLFSIIGLNMVLYKNKDKKSYPLKVLLLFSLPLVVVFSFLDFVLLIVYSSHLILLVSIVNFQLYNNLFKLGFSTFLTFFFACLVGAVITGAASFQHITIEEMRAKEKFANHLLLENDVMTEFLLGDIIKNIQEDVFIRNRIADPLLSKEPIERKIKKIYLTNYFDQFSHKVIVYNKSGESFSSWSQATDLDEYKMKYMNSDYATEFRNLYFINSTQTGEGNRFVSFINIYNDGAFLGTILIELNQQRSQAGSVFPRLLLDNKYAYDVNERNFDYAVYKDGILEFSSGVFNYRGVGMSEILEDEALYTKGSISEGYHHFAVKNEGKTIVISSPPYPVNYLFADIAFFFVSFLIFSLVFISFYLLLFGFNHLRFNYATKLQLYLNFAFFFPMLIISIIAVGFLSHSYTEDLHRQYYQKAGIIRDNLNRELGAQLFNNLNKDEIYNEIFSLASATGADINIYLPNGLLMATNQPTIFDKKILTNYLHPKAYATIIESQENQLLQTEQVGNLTYKTAYLALRNQERQKLHAIIAIPFFQAEEELNQLIAEVFSNILIIFVVMFLIFLVISYFVSKHLTHPFKLLTQKLKETNLEGNEYMNWPAKDEIGLLVNEYNNMLYKLEASKKVLASNEKESAWREMAKQVAHEIKNPLTPMKLTLQHLLRLRQLDKLEKGTDLEKPILSIINQVDTLSDIATSFSTFAKMPLPKNEELDFRKVVTETVSIYCNREDAQINFEDLSQSDRPLQIMGDEKLFGRVISNLIINGIQSVEENKTPMIHVVISLDNEAFVRLEIRDNGKGIDQELRSKIFLPNFSTKTEGSGLGLAIAKRGVETAGGQIWFLTSPGYGTSFFLSFPLVG